MRNQTCGRLWGEGLESESLTDEPEEDARCQDVDEDDDPEEEDAFGSSRWAAWRMGLDDGRVSRHAHVIESFEFKSVPLGRK